MNGFSKFCQSLEQTSVFNKFALSVLASGIVVLGINGSKLAIEKPDNNELVTNYFAQAVLFLSTGAVALGTVKKDETIS